ncbi:GIY-YIG nuclease family protein [Streptomyces sp. NPDC058947]|uniref:GIY-YIG nuclease family protein n=1 Tax=Streptomyces sp. NPDC058947 TaxID=3346675 RepID=UPI00368B4DE5
MGDGFVYVMGADELGSQVKIGWSDAPERRLRQLQTGLPYALTVRDKHPGPRALETFLKAEFADLRIRGEWFNFGDRDPLPLIAEAVCGWQGDIRTDLQGVAYTFDEPGLSALPKESGSTPADRVLALHVHVPERCGGALRWTRAKMAAYMGVSVRTVATAIEKLVDAGLIVEAERHGRLIYYSITPDR